MLDSRGEGRYRSLSSSSALFLLWRAPTIRGDRHGPCPNPDFAGRLIVAVEGFGQNEIPVYLRDFDPSGIASWTALPPNVGRIRPGKRGEMELGETSGSRLGHPRVVLPILLLLSLLLGGTVFYTVRNDRRPLPTYRIGIGPWVGFGPLYLAREKGFFKEA